VSGAAAIAAGVIDAVAIFLALTITGVGVWVLEAIQTRVKSLPVVGTGLADLVGNVEGWFLSAARTVVNAWYGLLTKTGQLVKLGVDGIVQLITIPLTNVVAGIWAESSGFFTVLTLGVLPPVEREIPTWFKHLDDEMRSLPNEPAFRSGGPIGLLLQWLSAIWAVVSKLGPFVRVVALPLLLALGVLWGLVETIGRITRLETIQAGLTRFTEAIRQDQLADEAVTRQLFTLWNQQSQQLALLQVDLEKERAARVALATQEEQARHALQTALEGQRQADKAQWSPLLILAVLAALGAAGVDVLRKTAECDPCAQLDQELPGLSARVLQLETYGE
jgi:hypothetical protein